MGKFLVYGEKVRRWACCRENTPFKNYVGQDKAIESLLDVLYQGFSNEGHCVQENLMLAGPPGTGKTTLVKMLAEALDLPLVATNAAQINGGIDLGGIRISAGVETVIHLILDTFARTFAGPLQGLQAGSFEVYIAEPMIFFIDEIHGLGRRTADSLLNATERNDAMIFGKGKVINCRNITWIGATTAWGMLPAAFQTRFVRVDLQQPTLEEVAQIVKLNNPSFDYEMCREVAHYGSLNPRQALAFARIVQRYSERTGDAPAECMKVCAQREGFDEWGMHQKHLEILQALKRTPLNLRNLSAAISCEGDEVVRHWIPPLLLSQPPLIEKQDQTYSITGAGIMELTKRGLA